MRYEPCPLSDEQLIIVRKMADGDTCKKITHDMGFSHLNRVYWRLRTAEDAAGARNAFELVATALRKGWIE